MREAPEPLSEAGTELDARALAAKRHARADAEHRTRELQHEDARPVHVHLAEQDALDLRDARTRRHAVLAHDAVEHPAAKEEREEPDRYPDDVLWQPAIEHGQIFLRELEQVAEQCDDHAGRHTDDIALNEEAQLEMTRVRHHGHGTLDAPVHDAPPSVSFISIIESPSNHSIIQENMKT